MVKTYTAEDVSLRSYRASTSVKANDATTDREIVVDDLPKGARVTRAVLSFAVSGVGAYGSNYDVCTVNGQTYESGGNTPLRHEVRADILGNRTFGVVFAYRLGYYTQATQFTVNWTGITLTIEFEQGEDEGYTDNEVLIPETGVYLYEPTETDFSRYRIKLQPSSCVVTEEAAGEYELELEHPFDPDGRWRSLLEEWIISAPIPPYKIPEITMPVGKVYRVKSTVTTTPLYSRLPTYTSASVDVSMWTANKPYKEGALCWWYDGGTVGNTRYIYRSGTENVGADMSPSSGGIWFLVGEYEEAEGTYTPGVVIRDLVTEEQVTYIATYTWKYVQVRDRLGHIGYVLADDLEETSTAPEPYVIPGKTVYRQLFRIYAVSCDETEQTVTVNARHISYDFQGNGIFDCRMTEADPATAIALLQGRLMNPDLLQYKPHYEDEAQDAESRKRLIACPIESPAVTADWSFANPIIALLDPDEGLAAKLQAIVLRDNGDFYILPSDHVRNGARLRYGVNLRGVTWERNTEDLVTRIIPRAGDGEDGYIYLDELFVDSEYISDYAVIRTEVLDSEYSVGQEIEKADGSKVKLSISEVIERMRREAENRYYVDGADKVTVTLDVDFILLGDTEEFRQYRNLQRVNLYDRITVDTGSTTVTAQVNGYEWDCLMARYNGISVGKIYGQSRRLPGYRVATGAITYSKLSPGLIKWIRGDT